MSLRHNSDNNPDGNVYGQSANEKIAFYGGTPAAQRANANQNALTDNSGGTASDTLAAISATYVQAEVRNSVASLAAKINELRAALVALGLIKGSA
jgi:hypothetical protein